MADLLEDTAVRPEDDDSLITLVELMFFAYRDFTGEADVVLAEYGLGRAHHRVLHFVRRHPGLRVTELLAILKITKQSLGRVLSPLIDDGWVESRRDDNDQRARQLYLTEKGSKLAERLARQQSAYMKAALAHASAAPNGKDSDTRIRRFLFAMIAPEERAVVETLLTEAAAPKTTTIKTARPNARRPVE